MLISQLILVPVFAIVVWGYFFFSSPCKEHRFGKTYDMIVIALAILFSLMAASKIYALNYDDYISTWKPVFAVLSSVHVFPLTMLAGMKLRKKLFPVC